MVFNPPPPPRFEAFTITARGGRLQQIITDVSISLPFNPDVDPDASFPRYQTQALWDTGATHSVISRSTAQALQLKPISLTRMAHAGGTMDVPVYIVNVYLPNHVLIHTHKVIEMADNSNIGMLIGMDIITLGDFAVTNVDGVTKISYRYPSIKSVDFVQDANDIRNMGKPSSKIGRNDPCPCGSGRKYKNCHGVKK